MSQIENLYKTILGRDSDAGGKAYWEGELAKMTGGGMSEADALSKIGGDFRLSDEYKNMQTNNGGGNTNTGGGNTNTTGSTSGGNGGGSTYTPPAQDQVSGFLDNLYKIAFDRDPDAEGKAYWMQAIQDQHQGSNDWQQWLTDSFHQSDEYKGKWSNDAGGDGTDDGDGDDDITTKGWWEDFDDADAFKDFLTGGDDKSSGGMDDFMKFMMMMAIMRPGGGGGGSMYGYGGMNPGGVQSAFDYKDMGSWMKDTFGSGGGSGNSGTSGNQMAQIHHRMGLGNWNGIHLLTLIKTGIGKTSLLVQVAVQLLRPWFHSTTLQLVNDGQLIQVVIVPRLAQVGSLTLDQFIVEFNNDCKNQIRLFIK